MSTGFEHTVINDLVETCRDGERGFRLVAQRVSDPGLRALFHELAAQRAAFAAELVPQAQRLGGGAAREGSRMATLHRAWMGLEQALGAEDHVLVHEAERGNRVSLDIYRNAVSAVVSPEARELIERQLDAIEEAQARIPVRQEMGERP